MTGSVPIVVMTDQRVVKVEGDDRRSFLDATLSQSVGDLRAGSWRGALWLDVHGAPLAAMDVVAEPSDEALVLLACPVAADVILETLAMRTFLAQATFVATDLCVVAIRWAASSGAAIAATFAELLQGAGVGDVAAQDAVMVLVRTDGVDVVGRSDEVAAFLADAGLPSASTDLVLLADHEVRQGIPRVGTELVGPHLPEEVGALPTHVHLAKGCYPGQEAVARMWMLGRPRRRLVVLDLDDRAPVGAMAGEGRAKWQVTRVTSVAPWRALAFAPSDVEVGQSIQGDSFSGVVRAVVGAGLPQPGADPKVTRRRDR